MKKKHMANGDEALKQEILSSVNSRLEDIEGAMQNLINVFTANKESIQSTPRSDNCSNSMRQPFNLSQDLDNLFASSPRMSIPNPTPTDTPRAILLDKLSKELAKRYVEIDAMAGMCHFKQVVLGEKKVCVEQVMKPEARLYDPHQNEHYAIGEFVEGGYLIWPESCLKYV